MSWVTMATEKYTYADELRIVRSWEDLRSVEFIVQIGLLLVASLTAWWVMNLWVVPLWFVLHYTLVFAEKGILSHFAERPSRAVFAVVLVINFLAGLFYAVLVVVFWHMHGEIYQYAAMALLVGATMNTLFIRSRVWQVLLCYMLCNAGSFVAISVDFYLHDAPKPELIASAVIAACIVTYFLVMTREAARYHNEHRTTAKALERSHKMEAVGTFSGGIAHDFNNVLNVVIGNLDLARHPDNPYDQKQLLEEAHSAALHGAKLTEQLMTLGRSRDMMMTHVDVSSVVADARALLQRVLPANIALSVLEDGCLPTLFVEESTLHASILNLGLNARDAMPKGGDIVIEARLASQQQMPRDCVISAPSGPTTYVCVSVADTGMGIDDKHIARVTEPFFSTKDESGGTGLGLTMVAGFVQRSDGALHISSILGNGTRVAIYLPVAREQPSEGSKTSRLGRAQGT